jgi:Zn-finger nucleic acid-binding protein
MYRHASGRDKEIDVDECYNCGGFFPDWGELRHIRDNNMSEAETKIK